MVCCSHSGFVLTRLLHVGNLSEGCLQTPEHERYPNSDPYLVSPATFFYIIKYPPDVAYWALTLSGNLFLLAIVSAAPTRLSRRCAFLRDFGTTALFFYISHLLLVIVLGNGLLALFGRKIDERGYPTKPDPSRRIDNLYAYFSVWASVIFIMWPLCRVYSRFKRSKPAAVPRGIYPPPL